MNVCVCVTQREGGREGRREREGERVFVPHRRGRETGVREEGEVEAPEQLFDYVTEEEYHRLVQQRQGERFILDDGKEFGGHVLLARCI